MFILKMNLSPAFLLSHKIDSAQRHKPLNQEQNGYK